VPLRCLSNVWSPTFTGIAESEWKNPDAAENNEVIAPTLAEYAVWAANFFPFRTVFKKSSSIFSLFATT
jgi:hypothetical protein